MYTIDSQEDNDNHPSTLEDNSHRLTDQQHLTIRQAIDIKGNTFALGTMKYHVVGDKE